MKKALVFLSFLAIGLEPLSAQSANPLSSARPSILTLLEKQAPSGEFYEIYSVIDSITRSSGEADEMGREIAGLRKKYADFDEYVSFIEKRNSDFVDECLRLMHKFDSAKKFSRMQDILLAFVGSEDFLSSKKRYEIFYELFAGPEISFHEYFGKSKDFEKKGLELFYEVETSALTYASMHIAEMNAAQARCLMLARENASPEDYKRMLRISEEITPSFAKVK